MEDSGSRSNIRRSERAPTKRKEEWESVKEIIRKYYIEERRSFEELCKLMKDLHGFEASEQQYRNKLREWKMFKNQKRDLEPDAENSGHGSSSKRPCETLGSEISWDPISEQHYLNIPNRIEMADLGSTPSYYPREQYPGLISDTAQANLLVDDQGTYAGDFDDPFNLLLDDLFWVDMNIYNQGQPLAQSSAHNSDINNSTTTRSNSMRQPIHHAAQSGSMNMVNLLLRVRPDCADLPDENGATPLWIAAQQGHIKLVKLLIDEYKVAVNIAIKPNKRTAIHQAAQGGHAEIVKILLDKGADPDSRDEGGISPLWSAAQQGSHDIVELLLKKGADMNVPSKDDRLPVHQAAQNGHTDVVTLLLDHGAKVDPRDKNNISPLWSAAQQGHSQIVKIFLEKEADPEVTSIDGSRRPIHQASQNGHVEVTRLLLNHNAQANPETDSFDTETPSPLWLAAQKGSIGIAELLIKHKADVNYSIRPSMRRPLHQAVQNGHVELVRLLIQEKAEVDAVEKDGWPPLMLAAQQGHIEIIEELLKANANINLEEKDGATPLWIAAQQGHTEIVRKLLDRQALSSATKPSKRYPIHQAAQNAHLEVVKVLVEYDPGCVNVKDNAGSTPLGLAAMGKEISRELIMEYLLKNRAHPVVS